MRVLLAALLCCCALPAAALSVTDDSGARVTFNAPPKRIISLAPNLTELIYAAGLGNRLVAVSAYSDYPETAKKLPQVGDAFRLDWERLVGLKPDLVLAWGSSMPALDRAAFAKLKLNLLIVEPRRLEDIPKTLRLLGRIGNTDAAAETAAYTFEKQRNTLRYKYASRPPMRVYIQIATAPLLTVNGKHIISDVLRLCGGQNVFSDAPLLVPAISAEALVNAQPQVLLAMAATREYKEQASSLWQSLPLDAVKRGHVGYIHPDLITRSSPRILQGAVQICELLELLRN